jgi:hypothetical protein
VTDELLYFGQRLKRDMKLPDGSTIKSEASLELQCDVIETMLAAMKR